MHQIGLEHDWEGGLCQEILQAIDQRFEDLEETIRLAAEVPNLQRRLCKLEKLQSGKGEAVHVPDDESMTSFCPDEVDEEKEDEKEDPEPTIAPTKSIIEISRAKISTITEKKLDIQTTEYYKFGPSTWDLAIFVGAGLGPLGSLQTIVLALVSVLMQVGQKLQVVAGRSVHGYSERIDIIDITCNALRELAARPFSRALPTSTLQRLISISRRSRKFDGAASSLFLCLLDPKLDAAHN